MDRHEHDKTTRLRSIIKRMERSIDDARARRITGDEAEDFPGGDTVIGGSNAAPAPANRPFDPLDTQIADSRPASATATSSSPSPVRDSDTMFDFDGPRLKAKPKRRSAS